MRYYWLRNHGHSAATLTLGFVIHSPAKFAARYGSTEEAIEEWRQHWLQTPEGRLYGGIAAEDEAGWLSEVGVSWSQSNLAF